ncbi:MAG: hypothetical protein ACXWKG_10605 [Limisphaerales bacterium]
MNDATPVDLNRRTQLKVVGWITAISILSIVGMQCSRDSGGGALAGSGGWEGVVG